MMLFALMLLLLLPALCSGQQLAFPSAEGFGRFASGGRGGVVYKVNNVATLRAAMETTGARTIVFTAGGTYDFHTDPIGDGPAVGDNLTVACQTAPANGDGVLLKGEIKLFQTRNVIMRHCRIRPGDDPDTAGANTNALVGNAIGPPHVASSHYSIYDHMSMGTSNDDVFGQANNSTIDTFVTLQHSISGETVQWNGEPGGGGQTKGTGTGGTLNNHMSFLNNVFANIVQALPVSLAAGASKLSTTSSTGLTVAKVSYLLPQYGPLEVNIVNN